MFERKEALFDFFLLSEEAFVLFKDLVLEKLDLDGSEKAIIYKVEDFKNKFRRMPTAKELELLKEKPVSDLRGLDSNVLSKEFLDFIRNEAIKRWVISVADKLEKKKVKAEELFEDVRGLVNDFTSKDLRPKQLGDVVDKVLERMLEPPETEIISTGIKSLDEVLYGGIRKGEFLCVIAPPGRGKSMSLINFCYGALLTRKNILFITLELSEEQIIARFIRRISQKSRKEIRLDLEGTKGILYRFMGIAGKLFVCYFKPHTLTADEILIILERASYHLKEPIDLIIIDYFDRMKMPSRFEYRVACGFLIDYLRDIAIEKHLAVVSATQANRASLQAQVITEEFVSESFKKIENSDIVLSLNRTQKDEEHNTAKFIVLKNREWGNTGANIPVLIDWERSYIGDLKDGGTIPEGEVGDIQD